MGIYMPIVLPPIDAEAIDAPNIDLCGVEPQLIKLEFIIYLPKLKVHQQYLYLKMRHQGSNSKNTLKKWVPQLIFLKSGAIIGYTYTNRGFIGPQLSISKGIEPMF